MLASSSQIECAAAARRTGKTFINHTECILTNFSVVTDTLRARDDEASGYHMQLLLRENAQQDAPHPGAFDVDGGERAV